MPAPPSKRLTVDDILALDMRPPGEWFAEVTEPLVEEFARDPDTLRRAVSAVREVFHFHERLYHYWRGRDPARIHNSESEKDFYGHLKKQSDAFGALEPAANATKHHVLRKAEPLPQGVRLTIIPAPAFDCGIATATEIHRTIGDGGPDTLATIQKAMSVYCAYLGTPGS
ncbi:hypothetical protein [Azospirillum endophyticum]